MRLLVLLIMFLGIAPRIAPAQARDLKPAQARELKRKAQQRLDAGLKAYGAGKYADSIRDFEAAYAIDPDPSLLYALAQAERLAGRCDPAMVHYRRYLESKPNPMQTEAANNGIELCSPTPTQPTRPEPQPVQPRDTPRASRAAPWYRDAANIAVLTGLTGIGIGTGFLVASGSSRYASKRAEYSDDFHDLLDRATQQRRVGITAITIGTALVGVGIVYHIKRRGQRTVVATDGSSIFVAGAF